MKFQGQGRGSLLLCRQHPFLLSPSSCCSSLPLSSFWPFNTAYCFCVDGKSRTSNPSLFTFSFLKIVSPIRSSYQVRKQSTCEGQFFFFCFLNLVKLDLFVVVLTILRRYTSENSRGFSSVNWDFLCGELMNRILLKILREFAVIVTCSVEKDEKHILVTLGLIKKLITRDL